MLFSIATAYRIAQQEHFVLHSLRLYLKHLWFYTIGFVIMSPLTEPSGLELGLDFFAPSAERRRKEAVATNHPCTAEKTTAKWNERLHNSVINHHTRTNHAV